MTPLKQAESSPFAGSLHHSHEVELQFLNFGRTETRQGASDGGDISHDVKGRGLGEEALNAENLPLKLQERYRQRGQYAGHLWGRKARLAFRRAEKLHREVLAPNEINR